MKQRLLTIYYKILGKLAHLYIKKNKPYVIGITGSVGKTSARTIISQVLAKYSGIKVYNSPKNFNGELGMSLSIFQFEQYSPSIKQLFIILCKSIYKLIFVHKPYDIIVLEYGIDHPGEMDFLLSIAIPDVSIITIIDKVHNMQFGNPQNIAKEKYKLILNARKHAFVNIDDKFLDAYINNIKCPYTTYSTSGKKDNVDIIINDEDNITIHNDSIHLQTNLIGIENISYIAIGFDIMKICITSVYNTIKNHSIDININLQAGRFSIFKGKNNSILIDSSYNASPASMYKAIENTIKLQKKHKDHNIVLALGDMRELGELTKSEHLNLASYIQSIYDKIQTIILVGESMAQFVYPKLVESNKRAPENIKWFSNSSIAGDFIENIITQTDNKYIILFKGSQNTIFMEESIKKSLSNPEDVKKLVRQSKFWLDKKTK